MVKAPGALRLLVVAIVATGLALAAAPAAAAPALTVTPATGLLDQSIVTVTGSGFTAGERLVVAQCAGATLDGCHLDPPINTTAAFATAGSDGAISVTLRLARVLPLDDGEVSCAVDCSILAATRGEHVERARTAVTFAATGTATVPDATLSIAVTGMRARGGRVSYTGSGYLPWYRASQVDFDQPLPITIADLIDGVDPGAYLAVCSSPPADWAGCERFVSPPIELPLPGSAFKLHEWVPVSASGTVSAAGRDMPRMWNTEDGRIDCAVEDCSFALEQDGAPHSNLVDVAWAPEWAPWPSASAFVAAVFPALLGRPATASERSAAIAGLTNRSLTGFGLLRRLAGQGDARPLAELTRLYQAALGRRPDATGLVYWESELRRTGSMSSIAVAIGRSPEFRQAFGPSVSDADAVTRAYQRILNRTTTFPGDLSYWVGRLQGGLARTHMIHLFSRTAEFLTRETGRSEMTAVTVALLRRGPTQAEWSAARGDYFNDGKTVTQRADDGVLTVLSSNQLTGEVG